MNPSELNADKVLQRYDAMKPEIGNKSYMDWWWRGAYVWGRGGRAFLRRLGGTSRDTKDVSKTTDAQYSAGYAASLPACCGSCSRTPRPPLPRPHIDLALKNHFASARHCSLRHQGQSVGRPKFNCDQRRVIALQSLELALEQTAEPKAGEETELFTRGDGGADKIIGTTFKGRC